MVWCYNYNARNLFLAIKMVKDTSIQISTVPTVCTNQPKFPKERIVLFDHKIQQKCRCGRTMLKKQHGERLNPGCRTAGLNSLGTQSSCGTLASPRDQGSG